MKAIPSRFRFVGTFALFLTLPFLTGADGNGCSGGGASRRHPAPVQQRAAHPRTARASRRHPTRSSVRAGLRSAERSAPRAPRASVNGTSRRAPSSATTGVRACARGRRRALPPRSAPDGIHGRPRVRAGTGRHLRMADSIVLDAGVSRAGLLPAVRTGSSRTATVAIPASALRSRRGRRRVDLHHRRGLRSGKPLRLPDRRSVCGDRDLLRRPAGPLQCSLARMRVRWIGGQHPLQRAAERVCTGAVAPSGRVHGLRPIGRCGRRWRVLPDRLGSVFVYLSRRGRRIRVSQSAARLCVVIDVRAGVRRRRAGRCAP